MQALTEPQRELAEAHLDLACIHAGKAVKRGVPNHLANSGAMLSGQDPITMGLKQNFPNSLEFQFLAQDKSGQRNTGSLCTPGTYVDIDGKTVKQHVIQSTGLALPLGEWVVAEAIVKDKKRIFPCSLARTTNSAHSSFCIRPTALTA